MENEQIIFNNVVILEHYKEYRAEQKLFGKTLSYVELYILNQIYNDAIEPLNNNIDENTSVFNEYTSVFNTHVFYLLCAIIIVFLIIFK
jgi:hypothetical protein